ncbi:MAG: OmpH family outer membrane protein [Alphaproteobacteria bacterium]|jgi:outer membrane protein|nr:OmpH family outer membrane protein [Candidatus Jidaibacter sp.]
MTFTKTIKTVLLASALALTSSFAGHQALADATQSGISVVDTQLIFEKSTAVQKVREQIDKKAEDFRKDSASKEAYFKKKSEELEKQKSVLAKDAFEQKSNDLAKEFGEAQKKVQENRAALDKAYMEAMQQFESVLSGIVQEQASKNGSKVVLPKMQTLYSDNALDITSAVLEAVNKKLPNIAVKF